MGRGRGKGKKQTAIAAREDPGSGEEEKILPSRRRGRPQKPMKDEIEEEEEAEKIRQGEEEEEAEKIRQGGEEEDVDNGENKRSFISNKDLKNKATAEDGRKRKRSSQAKESADSIKEENGVGTKSRTEDKIKSVGFRQNGSRRKNKPRRAAEVGVECKLGCS